MVIMEEPGEECEWGICIKQYYGEHNAIDEVAKIKLGYSRPIEISDHTKAFVYAIEE